MEKKYLKIRTNYLINPKFQIRFIVYFVFIGLMSLVVFYAANIFFFRTLIAEGFQLGLPANHVYFDLLESQKILMNKIFLITSILFFSLISLAGLFISHRIAGPISKMTKSLQEFNKLSDIKEIHFRKRDFFQELSSSFNQFISKIN